LARRVDVADRAAMADLGTEVHRRIEALDLLINNAGVALGATFLESTLEDWDWILDINLRGVVHGCHFFVPAMVSRGRGGHVVNVASMAGFVAGPALSAYCTTKFGVVGLSEAMRAELSPHRVGVTALCPGMINTPIVDNARRRGIAADEELHRATREMFRKRNYPPERVAERMLRAVARNRGLAPVTPEAWLFYGLKRLSPRLAAAAGRLLERMSTPATKRPRGNG
jgi:NAD(P)-dependent dehydrogenase (short-subunit alcohol dehydrogenase family)